MLVVRIQSVEKSPARPRDELLDLVFRHIWQKNYKLLLGQIEKNGACN